MSIFRGVFKTSHDVNFPNLKMTPAESKLESLPADTRDLCLAGASAFSSFLFDFFNGKK
jgi:hypothetical protein